MGVPIAASLLLHICYILQRRGVRGLGRDVPAAVRRRSSGTLSPVLRVEARCLSVCRRRICVGESREGDEAANAVGDLGGVSLSCSSLSAVSVLVIFCASNTKPASVHADAVSSSSSTKCTWKSSRAPVFVAFSSSPARCAGDKVRRSMNATIKE